MSTRLVTLTSVLVFVAGIAAVLALQARGVDSQLTLALAGMGLSIALVAATVLLVDESRRMREAQSAPYVSVTLRPWKESISLFELCIQNHGRGSARDIAFKLHGDVTIRDGSKLSTLRVFQNGVRYLEPGGFYVTVIGGPDFMSANAQPGEADIALRVESTYQGPSGKQYVNESWIEAREVTHATTPLKGIEANLQNVRDSLRNIDRSLGRLASGPMGGHGM